MVPWVPRLLVWTEPQSGKESAMTRETATTLVDPVCGMAVRPEKAAGMSRAGARAFYFCSKRCNAAFDAEPERYTDRAESRSAAGCGSSSVKSSCH